MENSHAYITVESYDGEKEMSLSFLLDDNLSPQMPSFDFISIDGSEQYWDNDTYLDFLFKVVDDYVEGRAQLFTNIAEISDHIPVERFKTVKDMFERAISMGLWER